MVGPGRYLASLHHWRYTANDHINVEKGIEAVATTSDETANLLRPCM